MKRILHTWIFAAVCGSRKDFTEFHNSLKPGPAFMMNMRHKVCSKKNKPDLMDLPNL